jgi:hypothetical protein
VHCILAVRIPSLVSQVVFLGGWFHKIAQRFSPALAMRSTFFIVFSMTARTQGVTDVALFPYSVETIPVCGGFDWYCVPGSWDGD